MSLGDIFSMLSQSSAFSGGQQAQGQGQSGAGELGNILGSLLGGAPAANTTGTTGQPAQSGADELGNLLGSFLGGGTTPANELSNLSSDPMGAVLGVLQSPMASTFIQPVVNSVAAKIGVPPQTAMAIVTFAIHYLMTHHGSKVGDSGSLNNLLQQHSSSAYIDKTGMAKDLAQQTGMDEKTAAKGLVEAFKVMGMQQ
jgi:hypothetical protein